MKLLVPFDALVFQLKNTAVLMECLVSEIEDVILHSLKAFEKNEPSMHVIEVDKGPGTEYYSYKQYAIFLLRMSLILILFHYHPVSDVPLS